MNRKKALPARILHRLPRWLALLLALALAGCSALPAPVLPFIATRAAPTRTPFQPVPPTPLPPTPTIPPATPTPTGTAVWIDPALPPALRHSLQLPPNYYPADRPDAAALRLQVGGDAPAVRWVYALVTPFSSMETGVSAGKLLEAWQGGGLGAFGGRPLLLDDATLEAFSALWGSPAEGVVEVIAAADLLTAAWDRGSARALIPFEALEGRWKVLEVDGQSPLRKEFDPAAYALSLPVSWAGEAALLPDGLALASNRDPAKLTTVALTGVTALVRATAYTMEQRGVLYPGKDVGDWLRQADIAHISNEVPFAKDCPFPNPVQEGMRFCSDARYIQLMEDVGTDVVELTGDHFQDWGEQAMLYTLELYRQRGWPYYGGGQNLEDGRKAVILEHNGNRIAFIGCNGKGGSYAQAAENHPGAVKCDMGWMQREIARLSAEGVLVIATFQHFEYYTYQAQPDQKRDFRALAEAGAVVVSGSQAHQPQAFEFAGGSLIHYGLGNLFFDQYDVSPACRQAFIDRHVFYDGRYVGTELLPIVFVDYARARPMNTGEAEDLLRSVFRASGW